MQLPLFGPCCEREERWPVRAIRVRWTEGVGSEEVEPGAWVTAAARDVSPRLPSTFATWRWPVCSLTTDVPWSGILGLPFAGSVAVVTCGTSTYLRLQSRTPETALPTAVLADERP